jgi:hypothetical protein
MEKPRLTSRVRAGLYILASNSDRTIATGDHARALTWIDEMQAFTKKKGGFLQPRGSRRKASARGRGR